MAGGMMLPPRMRHWRDAVMRYDLGRKTEPRPFLQLSIEEQAFVVARTTTLARRREGTAK
jgi:hypothetical protein